MRKIVLATGEIYHVFNRGIEKRSIFMDKREYERAFSSNVLDLFSSKEKYRDFVFDQIDYAKKLESINHLVLE